MGRSFRSYRPTPENFGLPYFNDRSLDTFIVMHSLLGLTLEKALETLQNRQVSIVETAPPFAARHYTPIWGQQRVLRVRERPDNGVELLIGYELLREEKNDPAKSKLNEDAVAEVVETAD